MLLHMGQRHACQLYTPTPENVGLIRIRPNHVKEALLVGLSVCGTYTKPMVLNNERTRRHRSRVRLPGYVNADSEARRTGLTLTV